jgi:glyoxylase-like metal-dependent hydrolase (beta-lactamase superfamily II)
MLKRTKMLTCAYFCTHRYKNRRRQEEEAVRNPVILGAIALIAILVGAMVLSGNALRKNLYAQAIPTDYFEAFAALPEFVEPVSGNVYAFAHGFNRSIVVDTAEGLVVIDTFNPAFAASLKEALAREFPGKRVRWVIYSHNHLDHIRGAEVLEPEEIIGHSAVNGYLADWAHIPDLSDVTRPVDGDAALDLGGTRIEMLFMPNSHSDTLYGFYIPSADTVFAPDMMFVRALPPFDFPDFYYPGFVRALDRLLALEAAHYIPSHMARGSRQDLADFRDMTVRFHEAVQKHVLANDFEAADGAAMRQALKSVYDELQPIYGDWHGFDAMFVPKFGRHWGGTYLGY